MKKTSGSKEGKSGNTPSQEIDARIMELKDWRGEMLARIRILIKQADHDAVEEVKWRKPVSYSHHYKLTIEIKLLEFSVKLGE